MTLTQVDELAHLKATIDLAKSKDADSEQILIINNVNWEQYENLLESIGDNSGILLKYGEETLTIMSPSRNHEFNKKIIGILLETYLFAKQIKFYPSGSTTFRNQTTKKGIEPDESYCFNHRKEFPDLAIEILITSGGINTLQIYKDLAVPEVWFWQKKELKVYVLKAKEYKQVKKSSLLPDLNLDLLANYVTKDEPLDAVLEFRKLIEQ